MSLHKIKAFASAPNPGFHCTPAIAKKSKKTFIASIEHTFNKPATDKSLAALHDALGKFAGQAAAVYKQHDGLILYKDPKSHETGIALLPIKDWKEAAEDMRGLLEYLQEEPENDPDQIYTGVAFATVISSGNYFVIPIEGPSAGKVFYADHDGWYESAFASDFDGFLARLVEDPVRLLNKELGCHTRYSDGDTDTQWIPMEYLEDITEL